MTLNEYTEAIEGAISNLPNDTTKEVFSVIQGMWADNEEYVVQELGVYPD